MNDKQRLLQAIRRAAPRKLPRIYLKNWENADYPQAPDDLETLPPNSLVIELVELEPSAAHLAAVARAEPRTEGSNALETLMEKLRHEKPRP